MYSLYADLTAFYEQTKRLSRQADAEYIKNFQHVFNKFEVIKLIYCIVY